MASQRDNYKQVRHEDNRTRAWREWMQRRVAQVHRSVSAFEVLQRHGVALKSSGEREEQFSCPFHGVDNKPSAKIYPESARSPSHAWCYVCQERWDAIAIWRKFNGGEELPFSRAVAQIEKTYGLAAIEPPRELNGVEGPSEATAAFDHLCQVCENRLRLAKTAYMNLGDMVGYLSASSLLDKVHYRVGQAQLDPAQGMAMLQQLLAKIGAKERSSCGE